jgi:hypothetical protein
LGGGLRGTFLDVRRRPGLGLRSMARHAVRAGLIASGVATGVLLVEIGAFQLASLAVRQALEPGMLFFLLLGPLAGLCFAWSVAGLDLLQHWTLRLLLAATSPMPLRWLRFLAHAVDRGLLMRVDRAWEFPDRLIRDGFAVLGEDLRGTRAR